MKRDKCLSGILRRHVVCGAFAVAALLSISPASAQVGSGGPNNAGMTGGYAAPAGAAPGSYVPPAGGYGAAGPPGTYSAPGTATYGPPAGTYGAPVTPAYGAPAPGAGAPAGYGALGAPGVAAHAGYAPRGAPGTFTTAPSFGSAASAVAAPSGSAVPAGVATAPSGVSISSLSGAISNLTPQQVNAATQALGISPNEALLLQQQLATGVISPQEVQSLCAHLAAANINPTLIQSVAGTIGLNAAQLQQVQSCLPAMAGGQPSVMAAPNALPAAPQPAPSVPSQAGVTPPPATYPATAPSASVSPAGPSLIEQNYAQIDLQLPPPDPSPANLNQFGYSIFASTVSSFAPIVNFPVGSDYVIGPGDQLNIYMWGRLNQTLPVLVDRDGSVGIPGIEPLQVGGLTFEQARKLIEGRVSQISNVNAHVAMGPLRTIQVLVVGAVNQPGSYTISPMSRVSAALIAAGGPAKIGTLRAVELRRGNQVIKRIDYYKLLLSGDNSDDLFLDTNDVVFVPPIGTVVAVTGDVQRPAIYELHKGRIEVSGALRLAAGTSPFSDTERVQVERVDQHRRLIVLDVPYGELSGRHFELHDGDLVKVFHMLTGHRDVVVLTGNVRRPGEFQWRPNLRVSDLVAAGGGVAEHTYFKYALLRRVTYPSQRQRFIQIDLKNALEGDPRSPADQILQPLDEVDIFNEDALRQAPTATVTGEVQLPGSYALSPGVKLSDLLYMAGGLRDDADFSEIQIDRTVIVDGSKTRFIRLYGNLHKSPGHPSNDPLILKNDQVYVTVATGWHPPWTVMVSGEVMRPGTYPIAREERLSALLLKSGGLTSGAFPRGIIFTRASVQQIEQDRLNESVAQLTQGLAQFSMFTQVSAEAPGGKPGNAATMLNLQNLLVQAQTQQATGRVVVRLDTIAALAGSSDDIVLQNGDSITIPQVPASVSVLGSVNEPSSIAARPGWTVADYLYRAGGPTPYADTDMIMVVKADGSVITQSGLNHAHPFPFSSVITGGLMGLHLQAGDTVYVPNDVQTFVKTQYALSVSTIVANAAQSLAIVALVATKL